MTGPLTFLAWYRHFNEKCQSEASSIGVSDCCLAQDTVPNPIKTYVNKRHTLYSTPIIL